MSGAKPTETKNRAFGAPIARSSPAPPPTTTAAEFVIITRRPPSASSGLSSTANDVMPVRPNDSATRLNRGVTANAAPTPHTSCWPIVLEYTVRGLRKMKPPFAPNENRSCDHCHASRPRSVGRSSPMNCEPSLPKLDGSDTPPIPASRMAWFSHRPHLRFDDQIAEPGHLQALRRVHAGRRIEAVAGEREHERQVRAELDLVGDAVRGGQLHLGQRRHDLVALRSDLRAVVDRVVDRERVRQERDERVERELLLVGDRAVIDREERLRADRVVEVLDVDRAIRGRHRLRGRETRGYDQSGNNG